MEIIFVLSAWRSDSKRFHRGMAWYPTMEEAHKAVTTKSLDICEQAYDWCVIEWFHSGLMSTCLNPTWYKWNEELEIYEQVINGPKELDNEINFGLC